MKIAFYLENKDIPNIDLSQPELGNPGCGGTEYLFVALPYYIEKLQGRQCEPVILANHIDNLPKNIKSAQVENVCDAARCAKECGCDFFCLPRKKTYRKRVIKFN